MPVLKTVVKTGMLNDKFSSMFSTLGGVISITIGDKIKFYRQRANMTQDELAKGICGKSYISKLENNKALPDEHIIELIKERLSIQNYAVSVQDVNKLKQMLYDWHSMIKNRQIEDATGLCAELEILSEKSMEPEIEITYKLFKVRLLMLQGNKESAKCLLEHLGILKSIFSDENNYFYNYFNGIYYGNTGMRKQALVYLLKAVEIDYPLKSIDGNLYYVISNYFASIDYFSHAIYYGVIAKNIANMKSETTYNIETESTIALSLNEIGESDEAERILKNCLYQVKNTNNKRYLAIIIHNLGCVYLKKKLYDKALQCFSEASSYCDEKGVPNINNILHSAYAQVGAKRNSEAADWIKKGLMLSNEINCESMTVLLKSLEYSQNLGNKDAVIFIENMTIPMLIKDGKHLKVIEYCEMLGEHYKKIKSYKKSAYYFELMNKYYQIITRGEILI